MKRSPLVRTMPLTAVAGLRRSPMHRRASASRPARRPSRNPLPADVRQLVVDRDGHMCRRCGASLPDGRGGSIHHRIPRGMGGTRWEGIHSPALLVLLCGDGTTGCHGWVEQHRGEALLLGWLLSRHLFDIDPEQIPLRGPGEGSVRTYLRHDGTAAIDLPNMPQRPEVTHHDR